LTDFSLNITVSSTGLNIIDKYGAKLNPIYKFLSSLLNKNFF